MLKGQYKLSSYEVEELYKIYSSNLIKLQDITKVYNLDVGTIYSSFKRCGIVRKTKISKKFSVQQELEIFKEYTSTNSSPLKIGKKIGCSHTTIQHIVKNQPDYIKKQYLTIPLNENFFEIIDTEEKAYWLGFIAADGCVTDNYAFNLTLGAVDLLHLEKFRKSIKSRHNLKYRKTRNTYSITIHNKKLCNDLINKNIVPRKSLILHPYLSLTKELIPHYIRGYFDGDGCISQSKAAGQYRIDFAGTEIFLQYILDNIKTTIPTKSKVRKQRNIYVLSLGGNTQVKKIFDYMYKDATVYLDRKYKKFQEIH